MLAPWTRGAEVMVVGTAHLAQLQPEPNAEQRAAVIDRLAMFEPTLVCIEAIPGDRVGQLLEDPKRYGELLATFAMNAVRLGPEQQIRWRVSPDEALREARQIESVAAELMPAARVRLIGLQLAGYEPWSALLNWMQLDEEQQSRAAERLGPIAADRLRAMAVSKNEIVSLAIPLAIRARQRRLCAADPFVDEASVQELEPELTPLLSDPAIGKGVEAFNAQQAAQWKSDRADGLVALLAWMNSAEFAAADRRAEWDIFDKDAGKRRLALWHARNSEIATQLYRAMAGRDGERVVMIVGAAHRPFLEQALRAQPWVAVRSFTN